MTIRRKSIRSVPSRAFKVRKRRELKRRVVLLTASPPTPHLSYLVSHAAPRPFP